jgi:non-specific serine/threonine protein kinase
VDACAALAAHLLAGCRDLQILITSREALGLAGETLWPVPPLALPPADMLASPEQLERVEAIALFVARAQAVRPSFALSAANARAVVQVCRRLDALPLAIELAATRLQALGVGELAARLDDRFRLLRQGTRTALPRQQTLRATLDWSWDLLSKQERRLLGRLSVFAGGWTLAAAAVCAGSGVGIDEAWPGGSASVPCAPLGTSLDPRGRSDAGTWDVLDLLAGLVAKSLVALQENEDGARYRLLETVRQYAAERLAQAGEDGAMRDAHLAYFLELAEEAEPQLNGPDQVAWLGRLAREHDNLRAALRWTRERGAAEEGLRLAGSLSWFWNVRDHLSEGRRWLEGALAASTGSSAAVRAKALNGAGVLAKSQGEYRRARAFLEEGLALWRALGDRQGVAQSFADLAWVAQLQGDYERAIALLGQSLALFRELEDRPGIAGSLDYLAWVVGQQGQLERAAALLEESLVLWRALGHTWRIAYALSGLGRVEARQGAYRRAAELLDEGLALWRELGEQRAIAWSLGNLGLMAYWQGEYGRAAALLTQSIQISRDTGSGDTLDEVLESLVWVAVARGQSHHAARLGGATEALREALHMPLPLLQRAGHARAAQDLRAALGEAVYAEAWGAGRALSREQTIALALEGAGG